MSVNEDKLNKANELYNQYGSDMDDIMLMENDEFQKVYQSGPEIMGNYGYFYENIKITKEQFGKVQNKVLDYLIYLTNLDLEIYSEEDIRCQKSIIALLLPKLESILLDTIFEMQSISKLASKSRDYMSKKELEDDFHFEQIVADKVRNTISVARLLNKKLENAVGRSR